MTTKQKLRSLEKRIAVLEGLPAVPIFTGLTETQKSKVQIIKATVCKFYDLHPDAIDCRSRITNLVWARHVAMKLCRDLLNLNDSEIGRQFKRSPWNTFPSISNANNKIRNGKAIEFPALEIQVKKAIA